MVQDVATQFRACHQGKAAQCALRVALQRVVEVEVEAEVEGRHCASPMSKLIHHGCGRGCGTAACAQLE